MVDEYNIYGAVDERLKLTTTPLVGAALPAVVPSGRVPAPGVRDEPDPPAQLFGGIDPGIVGGIVGFLLVTAIATKIM